MESISFEAIKEEVARKHKFTLSEDDPILATVTMCNMVVTFYQNKTETALDNLYKKLEDFAQAQEAQHAKTAARIINKSLEATEDTITSVTHEIVENFTTRIAEDQSIVLAAQQKQIKEMKRHRNISIACAVFSVVIITLALITG